MNKLETFLGNYYLEIGVLLLLIITFILGMKERFSPIYVLAIFVLAIITLFLKYFFTVFLNFFLTIRAGKLFDDNRTVNYLTFDFLKFVLILVGLVTIVILGLNRVLNNETIATLLGGLIGSLLTIKSGYLDYPKLTKEEQEKLDSKSTSTTLGGKNQ